MKNLLSTPNFWKASTLLIFALIGYSRGYWDVVAAAAGVWGYFVWGLWREA